MDYALVLVQVTFSISVLTMSLIMEGFSKSFFRIKGIIVIKTMHIEGRSSILANFGHLLTHWSFESGFRLNWDIIRSSSYQSLIFH